MTAEYLELTAGQDLDALTDWLNALPALALMGVRCTDLRPGVVRAEMHTPPEMVNPSGAVNGGALAFFIDQLGGAVASTLVEAGRGPVTTSLTVHYVAAARNRVVGTARVVRAGRALVFVEMEVHDDERLCATGTGVWMLTTAR
jgi:uncharacterized protein (TIGR00369 family)